MSLPNQHIQDAINSLNQGGVILHLTDTIWGLACDATNQQAVHKLRLIKDRPVDKSFLVLVHAIEQLKDLTSIDSDKLIQLTKQFGSPTTVVYPKAQGVVAGVKAPNGSLGIRLVQSEGSCLKLLKAFGKPLVSTSANLSGSSAPTSFNTIDSSIVSSVDFILESKDPVQSNPSSIFKLVDTGALHKLR